MNKNNIDPEIKPKKTKSSKKPDYDTALSYYFKKKHEYDNNYERTKLKYIRNKKLTLEKKKKKIKGIRRKCVNCKQVGGMDFNNVGGHLRVVCTAAEPCPIHIDLKRAHFMLMPNILEDLYIQKNDKMGDIIKLKLSLLFGLKDKDIITKEFESQKTEYKLVIDSFEVVKEMLDQLNKTTIDDNGSEKEISTDVFISGLEMRLKEAVKDFKTMINEYNNPLQAPGDGGIYLDKSIIVLQNAMELYLETITPLQDKIQRASYAYNAIEEIPDSDPKKYALIQKKYTDAQLEINLPGHEGQVIIMKLR